MGLQEHAAEMLLLCASFSYTLLVLAVPSQEKRDKVGEQHFYFLKIFLSTFS